MFNGIAFPERWPRARQRVFKKLKQEFSVQTKEGNTGEEAWGTCSVCGTEWKPEPFVVRWWKQKNKQKTGVWKCLVGRWEWSSHLVIYLCYKYLCFSHMEIVKKDVSGVLVAKAANEVGAIPFFIRIARHTCSALITSINSPNLANNENIMLVTSLHWKIKMGPASWFSQHDIWGDFLYYWHFTPAICTMVLSHLLCGFILSVGQPCKDSSIPCKLEIFIHGGGEEKLDKIIRAHLSMWLSKCSASGFSELFYDSWLLCFKLRKTKVNQAQPNSLYSGFFVPHAMSSLKAKSIFFSELWHAASWFTWGISQPFLTNE